jgi:hypothetical protein
MQGSFHGFYGSVNEGKKLRYVVSTISTNDQMETGPKDINCKLNSDKLKKLIKNGYDYLNLSKTKKIIHPLGCTWLGLIW